MAIFPLILFTVMLDRLSERETTQCVGKKTEGQFQRLWLEFLEFHSDVVWYPFLTWEIHRRLIISHERFK